MPLPVLSVAQLHDLAKQLIHLQGWTIAHLLAENLTRFALVLKQGILTQVLFFCFEKPLIRFHLIQSIPEALSLSHYSHPLTPYLSGAVIKAVELIQHDRILSLQVNQRGKDLFLIGEFFLKHPNYYMLDKNSTILLSLYPLNKAIYELPPALIANSKPENRFLTHEEMESMYCMQEKLLTIQKEKEQLAQQLKNCLKRTKKRQELLLKEFAQNKQWESIQHRGDLLKTHFHLLKKGIKDVTVWDWLHEKEIAIELDPLLQPADQLKAFFRRAKKMQKSLVHLNEQLKKTASYLENIYQALSQLSILESLEELLAFKMKWQAYLPALPVSKSIKERALKLPYYEYESEAGIKIWVGKNAKYNEILTFQYANGNDWWLHINHFPGSHVIIKMPKGQEPDQETLLDAMELALHHSKAKELGEAEISLTQRKFVSRLGKQTGKVQISKHKQLWMRHDPVRYNNLKQRKK